MRLSKVGVVFAVASCLTVLAGCVQSQGRKEGDPKKRVSATIFLIGPDTGNCKAKVSPYQIQPKNNEAADWTVIDLCANVTNNYTETVTLTFTPEKATNCGSGPIFGTTNVASGTNNFQGDIDVKCGKYEKFKYTVSIRGSVLSDPELEIAQ